MRESLIEHYVAKRLDEVTEIMPPDEIAAAQDHLADVADDFVDALVEWLRHHDPNPPSKLADLLSEET